VKYNIVIILYSHFAELNRPFRPFCINFLLLQNQRFRRRLARLDELHIIQLTFRRAPVDVKELRQGAFDGGVVEPQGNEAALPIQRVAKPERAGLQLRPVRLERLGRHAEHQHARVLQPFLDFRRNAVAGLERPFIEPDLQSARNRSASGRTTALSLLLWLRKRSNRKSSFMSRNSIAACLGGESYWMPRQTIVEE
jgi:hypothetical protein